MDDTPVPAPPAPSPAPGPDAALPLGERQRLAPAVVVVQRIGRGIAALVLMGGMGVQLLVRLLNGYSPLALGLEFLAVAALLAWWAFSWPAIAYRHASWVVSSDGIEITRGVVWRTIINVPRSRVQHTDVSQGPIERAWELGSLSIYTAGTDHAHVRLPGLTHADALRLRNHLLPGQADDAV